MFGEMFVGVVKHIQHFTQQRKTKFVLNQDQTLPNAAKQIKCYETKQGGQTSPTFHQTFVFEMLGEMIDLFDRGLPKPLLLDYIILRGTRALKLTCQLLKS